MEGSRPTLCTLLDVKTSFSAGCAAFVVPVIPFFPVDFCLFVCFVFFMS